MFADVQRLREEREERKADRDAFLAAINAMRDVVTAMAATQQAFYQQFHAAQPAAGWTNDDLKEAETEAMEMAERLKRMEEGHDVVDLPSLAQLMGGVSMDH